MYLVSVQYIKERVYQMILRIWMLTITCYVTITINACNTGFLLHYMSMSRHTIRLQYSWIMLSILVLILYRVRENLSQIGGLKELQTLHSPFFFFYQVPLSILMKLLTAIETLLGVYIIILEYCYVPFLYTQLISVL